MLARLEADMRPHLTADDYATSTISNVYFDNDEFQMIQDSIARKVVAKKCGCGLMLSSQ